MPIKDIRPALRAILLGDVDVSNVVGVRVYPALLPQGVTNPSIVYNIVTEHTDYHMNGPSGLKTDRIQIDCWSQQPDQAVALANDVEDVLSGFSGTVSFGSISPQESVVIHAVFQDTANDIYDPTSKMYSKQRDYFFWYYDQ